VDILSVNRERADLDTAFPRYVIIHPEKVLFIRLAVEDGGSLTAARESGRLAGRPCGREQERVPRSRPKSMIQQ
jgi:hypothetical protein